MNVTRLLILGTIRYLGMAHGYALRRQLDDWRVETWTTVRSGSIYHALGQLHKEGKLATSGRESGARGTERTVFSLTHEGTTEFFSLLEKAVGSFDLPELSAGIAFVGQLPPERAQSLLVSLHARLNANKTFLQKLSENMPNDQAVPRTADLLDLWTGYLEATARSVARLERKIASERED
ncbi:MULTISPECIES: PadR family transcriptional regulator [unclassified Rhizobium]|uniref:PadR family transcriptional regulator n=1 Tax=unclassified Rhizobium TaxID=2613769 RepID=UPI003818045A